jgi:hypothetical protein
MMDDEKKSYIEESRKSPDPALKLMELDLPDRMVMHGGMPSAQSTKSLVRLDDNKSGTSSEMLVILQTPSYVASQQSPVKLRASHPVIKTDGLCSTVTVDKKFFFFFLL